MHTWSEAMTVLMRSGSIKWNVPTVHVTMWRSHEVGRRWSELNAWSRPTERFAGSRSTTLTDHGPGRVRRGMCSRAIEAPPF